MNDKIFMDWLEPRVITVLREHFGGKKRILALDDAPLYHASDPKIKIPVSNTKRYTIEPHEYARVREITLDLSRISCLSMKSPFSHEPYITSPPMDDLCSQARSDRGMWS